MIAIDVEMPKDCNHCPFSTRELRCVVTKECWNWGMTERKSNCPLIAIEKKKITIRANSVNYKTEIIYVPVEEQDD